MNRKFKDEFIWNIFFCNSVNTFTVTFEQFNAPLQNKIINFFQKKILLAPNYNYNSVWVWIFVK